MWCDKHNDDARYCACNARQTITVAADGGSKAEAVPSTDWVGALRAAYDAMMALMELEQGVELFERGNAITGATCLLRGEIQKASAPTVPDEPLEGKR